jgi:hypothetical protein
MPLYFLYDTESLTSGCGFDFCEADFGCMEFATVCIVKGGRLVFACNGYLRRSQFFRGLLFCTVGWRVRAYRIHTLVAHSDDE